MTDHKQSFLERLTGIRKMDDEEFFDHSSTGRERNDASLKPHAEQYDNREAEREHYTNPRLSREQAIEDAPEEEVVAEEEEEEEAGLAIDMYESDNELIIQSMIAGITPDNLHIAITRDSVTLSGRRVAPQGITEEQYMTREIYWGTFSRVVELPFEINTDGAEAVEKYGLLIIRLPKLDTHRTHQLRVKSI